MEYNPVKRRIAAMAVFLPVLGGGIQFHISPDDIAIKSNTGS